MSAIHSATFKEYWLREPQFKYFQCVPENRFAVYCNLCCKTINLSNMGRQALAIHAEGKSHKRNAAVKESMYSLHLFSTARTEVSAGQQSSKDGVPRKALARTGTQRRLRSYTCGGAVTGSQSCYGDEVAVFSPDSVDGRAVPSAAASPVQFEMITVPSSEEWKDVAVDASCVEPIATTEKRICRLCVKNEGTVPIFQDDGHLRVLAVQIMSISKVKVSSSDGLPSHICNECVNMVHSCFNFKVQCEASDATLRATLVASQCSVQEVDATVSNSNFATVSSQLNETSHKLNTLVSSMKDLQRKYDGLRKPAYNAAVREPRGSRDVMDVVVDGAEEDLKTPGEFQGVQDFRGFSPDAGGRWRHGGGTVGFSEVPDCYLVELDGDVEWEVKCPPVDSLWS